MSLANPFGLIGLAALPVILTLHLLRERQRRYVVSHLELWAFLNNEVRGPRTRRLPITWLLVLDLLIAALLSLAWSQPQVALAMPAQSARHRVILLDVSTSMRARDLGGDRFAQAQAAAAGLLEGAGPRDVVTLIAFGREARLVADSRLDGAGELAARLASLRAGETGAAGLTSSALRDALALGQASLDRTLPAEFHVFTDGNFDQEPVAFAYPLTWHWTGGPVDNQAITELNATPVAGERIQVFARLANFSSLLATRTVTLQVNGERVDQAVVEIPADSTVPRVWQVPAGFSGRAGEVLVTLDGADALREDDTAAIGLQPGGEIRVALVTENPSAILQAVQAIPGVDETVIPPADYEQQAGSLPPFDLAIFRGYLPTTWPAGQVVVVEPPRAGEAVAGSGVSLIAGSRSDIPANSTVRAAQGNPLVEGIDFSGVRWSRAWTLASPPAGFATLLQAGDVPLLVEGEMPAASGERSQVVVLLADLSRGNLTRHPAFPILMANLVVSARQAPLPASFPTGAALALPPAGSYQAIHIRPPRQAVMALEQSWPAVWTETLDPGLYHVRLVKTDGEVSEFFSGALAGDEAESDLRPRAWTQAAAGAPAGAGDGQESEERQVDLRAWLLGAALLALLVEAVLAWRR